MTQREIRGGSEAEIRAEEDVIRVVGYAAVFDEETTIAGRFREVIKRGAFQGAIGRDDVPFLIEHEGLPIARSRGGSLVMEEDERGLRIEATLDAHDPDVQRIVPKMKRGILDKMSFSFRTTRGGETWDRSGSLPLRNVTDVELYDVSVVGSPAYEGTDIALRSLEEAIREETRKAQNFKAAAKRVAMKQNLDQKVRRA